MTGYLQVEEILDERCENHNTPNALLPVIPGPGCRFVSSSNRETSDHDHGFNRSASVGLCNPVVLCGHTALQSITEFTGRPRSSQCAIPLSSVVPPTYLFSQHQGGFLGVFFCIRRANTGGVAFSVSSGNKAIEMRWASGTISVVCGARADCLKCQQPNKRSPISKCRQLSIHSPSLPVCDRRRAARRPLLCTA